MPQQKLPENTLTPQERNKLVEENINLVRMFAHKLCKDYQLFDDCVQEGVLGLMRAARLYDENREGSFTSFASFEIQCSIRDFLFRNRTIKLPDDQRTQINRYQTAVRKMEVDNVEITSELLIRTAKEVGLSREVHAQLLHPIASLNSRTNISSSDDVGEFGDMIADNYSEDPIENMAYEELVAFMRNFFESAKIADEKTKRVVIRQMDQFIESAFGGKNKSLTELVAKEYPELALTSKEFNQQYTRISGVWRTQFNKFKEVLRTTIAYI